MSAVLASAETRVHAVNGRRVLPTGGHESPTPGHAGFWCYVSGLTPKILFVEDCPRGVAADAGYTPGQTFNTKHPRREAGAQSHGTPPESAGLPAGRQPGHSSGLLMTVDQGCSR
jgi:hypothetical protein